MHARYVAAAAVAGAIALAPAASLAEGLDSDDTWAYRTPTRLLAFDGALAVGMPSVLPTGIARGLGAGVTGGRRFAWGARIAGLTASENAEAWAVTHRELRLRVTGAIQHAIGRGIVGLRLGVGGTLVHETRTRHQGMRAALEGDALETTALAMLPAATAEAVIGLHIRSCWRLQIAVGPTFTVDGGEVSRGFAAEIGVAWQP